MSALYQHFPILPSYHCFAASHESDLQAGPPGRSYDSSPFGHCASALTLSPLRTLPFLCFRFPPIVPLNATVDQAVIHPTCGLFHCQFVPVLLRFFYSFSIFIRTLLSYVPFPSLSSHTYMHIL